MVKNLKFLRTKRGISQQQLGEIIGFSQQSIHKYETQLIEPDIRTLVKLADYFETSVDFLIGHNKPEKPCEDEQHSLSLTEDETELIKKYRSLSSDEQKSIDLVIKNYIQKK